MASIDSVTPMGVHVLLFIFSGGGKK